MFSSLSALFVFTSFLTLKAGSMRKVLLVALIGLFSFFSSPLFANSFVWKDSSGQFYYVQTTDAQSYIPQLCSGFGGVYSPASYPKSFRCKSTTFTFVSNTTCAITGDPTKCNPPEPVLCSDGSTAPDGDVSKCPINCDILSGGGGPDCDTEEPPNDYCSETQTPIFDDCQYSPDDPRNPDNQPDPEDHCEQFPDSVSCNTELPELPDTDFCKTYPNALSCQTPEIPDLGTDTNPPPAGGTGVGTDTGTGTGVKPPPPEPPPTNSDSSSASTDARLDSLRYDISRLHSGLNYQTGIIAAGLTGVSKQLQANGGKIDRSNTLLDGINKNLDVLNGGLKGDALTSGNFDVEGGINSALGITGDEKISDLVDDPVKLSDYTDQYDQFLSDQNLSCSNVLPTIEFSVMGKQYSFDINYQPACDWLANLGNFLLFITWIGVPAIVFGRRS